MAIEQVRVSPGTAERIVSQQVTITSAQLLALNATPITLVPAPAAGNALIFEGAILMLDWNAAAYAGIAAGEDLSIKYTGAAGLEVGQVEATGFLDAVADAFRYCRPHGAASGDSGITPVAAAPLVLHMLTGEIITGDSPLHVKTYYRVVPLNLAG